MEKLTRQGQEHIQSTQFGHDYVGDAQVRRLESLLVQPLTTVCRLRDLVPLRFEHRAEESTDGVVIITDQNRGHHALTGVEDVRTCQAALLMNDSAPRWTSSS